MIPVVPSDQKHQVPSITGTTRVTTRQTFVMWSLDEFILGNVVLIDLRHVHIHHSV